MTDTTTPRRGASPTVKKLKVVSNGLLILSLPAALAAFFLRDTVPPVVPISVFVAAWTAMAWSMALRFIARTPAARRTPKNVFLSGREAGLLPVVLGALSLLLAKGHPQMWTYTLIALAPVVVFLGVVIAGIVGNWPSPNQVDMDTPEVAAVDEVTETEAEPAETEADPTTTA